MQVESYGPVNLIGVTRREAESLLDLLSSGCTIRLLQRAGLEDFRASLAETVQRNRTLDYNSTADVS